MSEFDSLLNSFEQASQAPSPYRHGYAGHRKALIEYVRKLEAAQGYTSRPSLWAMLARDALEMIATPRRPDGTWNHDRESCRLIAAEALWQYDDRTLLERAAKAACYAVKPHSNNGIGRDLVFVLDGKNWNPLTDDGDALRLAVKLCLDIITRVSDRETWAQAPMVRTVIEPWAADPYAATRRAIVRAAAALAPESGHD